MNSSYVPILRLPANDLGRDFIIGDIHGQYLRLLLLLEGVRFNPDKGDRLFSVGDIVDRGPHSLEMLALLSYPWFHAAKGNHEVVACGLIRDMLADPDGTVVVAKGMDENMGCRWIADHWFERASSDWQALCNKMDNLPTVIVVGEGSRRFHVTHAGLVSNNKTLSDEDLDHPTPDLLAYLSSEDFVWSRALLQRNTIDTESSGFLSATYCGHSYVPSPTLNARHLLVDTGAAYLSYPAEEDSESAPLSITMVRHTVPADLSSTAVSYVSVGRMLTFEPTQAYAQQLGLGFPTDDDATYRRYSGVRPAPASPVFAKPQTLEQRLRRVRPSPFCAP